MKIREALDLPRKSIRTNVEPDLKTLYKATVVKTV